MWWSATQTSSVENLRSLPLFKRQGRFSGAHRHNTSERRTHVRSPELFGGCCRTRCCATKSRRRWSFVGLKPRHQAQLTYPGNPECHRAFLCSAFGVGGHPRCPDDLARQAIWVTRSPLCVCTRAAERLFLKHGISFQSVSHFLPCRRTVVFDQRGRSWFRYDASRNEDIVRPRRDDDAGARH